MTHSRTAPANWVIIWLSLAVVVTVFCACWILIRTNYEPQPHVPNNLITVTEFYACTGWDDDKNGLDNPGVFSSDAGQIFACGHLHTNQPITVSVRWYYERKSISREVIHNVQDRFVSSINPINGAFRDGNYQIQLNIGRAVVWRTKFRVEQ